MRRTVLPLFARTARRDGLLSFGPPEATSLVAGLCRGARAGRYVVIKISEPWLGREDSNLRMAESKSAALPLGYAPEVAPGK